MIARLWDLSLFGGLVAAVAPRLLDRSDRWAEARRRGHLPESFFRTMGPRP